MKRSLLTIIFSLALALSALADVKISNLPAGSALAGTEPVPAVQGGATVRTTPAAIDTYIEASENTWSGVNTFTGALGFGVTTNASATGTNATLQAHPTPYVRATNAGLVSVAKINRSGVQSGHIVYIDNSTGNTITIVNNFDVSGEQIMTGFGGDVTLAANGTAAFVYDGTGAHWNLVNNGQPVVPFARGGTGLTTAADDRTIVSSGSAWVATSLPACTDTGGNHLNYDAATNGFSCGTSVGTVNAATGVTGTLPVANGGTNLTAAADDAAMIGNGTTWQSKSVPACADTGGNHLNYDASTNTFSCGTSGSGGMTAGTFTVTWTQACSTDPTQTWNYLVSGDFVIINPTQEVSCTGDSTFFISQTNDVPSAIRQNSGTVFLGPITTQDNGTTVPACLFIESDFSLRIRKAGTDGLCSSGGGNTWTSSGTRAIYGTTNLGPNNFVYNRDRT